MYFKGNTETFGVCVEADPIFWSRSLTAIINHSINSILLCDGLLVPVLGYYNSASIINCASSRGCESDDGCLLDAQPFKATP